jgi:predicted GNAT family acetyltransferase
MVSGNKKTLTLKTLNKSNIWDVQENDVLRMWDAGAKDSDFKDSADHYREIIKTAFDLEDVKVDRPEVLSKYEARGFKTAMVKTANGDKKRIAIKKKPIQRVTDLTYENINHITAAKLLEVIERNFGGGWESLSQSIQDIIEHGFDISTTTLPTSMLKKKGGMYEKKVEDGYEVLEIPKGTWTEAIFAKEKPRVERVHTVFAPDAEDAEKRRLEEEEDNDEDLPDVPDDYNRDDDEDGDEFDDDKLTEESYRTTVDTMPEDLDLEAAEVADDDDDY